MNLKDIEKNLEEAMSTPDPSVVMMRSLAKKQVSEAIVIPRPDIASDPEPDYPDDDFETDDYGVLKSVKKSRIKSGKKKKKYFSINEYVEYVDSALRRRSY